MEQIGMQFTFVEYTHASCGSRYSQTGQCRLNQLHTPHCSWRVRHWDATEVNRTWLNQPFSFYSEENAGCCNWRRCLTQPMMFQSSVFKWNPLYRGLHHKELLLALFTCILGRTWVQHALFWDLSTLMSSGSEVQIAHVVFFPCPTKADTVAIVT